MAAMSSSAAFAAAAFAASFSAPSRFLQTHASVFQQESAHAPESASGIACTFTHSFSARASLPGLASGYCPLSACLYTSFSAKPAFANFASFSLPTAEDLAAGAGAFAALGGAQCAGGLSEAWGLMPPQAVQHMLLPILSTPRSDGCPKALPSPLADNPAMSHRREIFVFPMFFDNVVNG